MATGAVRSSHDQDGKVLWTTPMNADAIAIDVDSNGYYYVCGQIVKQGLFYSESLTYTLAASNYTSYDVFVAKFDPSGHVNPSF